jgi:transglutaminase-like putative cysteine protease
MRKGTRHLVRSWLLFLACCNPLWAVSVPDWVHQAASQTLPSYPPDTNAVVLLAQEEMTVTAPGEYVQHYRHAVKILRPDGRDEGSLWVHLGHEEKLLSLHAWSIDKTGREYELKEKDFQERSPYSDSLFSDIRYRTVLAPSPEPGSVIAIEYEIRRRAWHNQLHWVLQDDIPVRETTFTVQIPHDWEYKASWSGTRSTEATAAGENRWQWTKRDLPALESEPSMPAFLALSDRMELAFYVPGEKGVNAGSWNGLGRWYAGLTDGRRAPTPEITEKVRQLTAGKDSFDGKLRALASFMQSDIRYVAVEIGIGGYQPHPASDVFHYRYGDCKDKATLLSSMLQETGIRSEYVLIHTERGVVQSAMPSAWFNHAILAVELPTASNSVNVGPARYRSVITAKSGKQYLIFDPTDTFTPVGELRSDLQDTNALLVSDPGGELIHTPLLPPEANLLTRTGHFTLSPDGSLSGEIAETLTGEHALQNRARLRPASEKERTEHFEHFLGRSLKGFTLQSSSIQQLDDIQKDLLLNLKFDAPGYAQIRGPLMLLRPRILGEKSIDLDHRKPRQYPVEFDGTSKETDVYEIELPSGYAVDDLPEPANVDVGFASYQSKIEVTGSKLRYWREYTRRNVDIGPERMADLRKFEGRIGADESASVVLKKIP